ncbi:MAG: PAS domain S-box protein [Deltaproteobacteria bacterium]|nr:PAS domain S-box protein [Deltaproteobacteria bacterium]
MKTKNSNTHPKQIMDIKCIIQDHAAVLNSVNDAIFMYESVESGPPGKFIYVNDAAVTLTEYSRAELMKLAPIDISAHLTVDDFELFRSEVMKTGRFQKEVTFATKTGQKIPVELKAIRTVIEGRNVGLAIARDITERVEAKARMRETEDRYRTHFENIHDVIYSVGADLIVTSVSPSIERFLGYTPDEFTGKPAHNLLYVFQPEYRDKAIQNLSLLLSGSKNLANVYGLITKDGKKVFAEIQGTPLIRDGIVTGSISVVRDITERKKAEDQLKESEQRYRYLAKNVPVGVMEVDLINDRFIQVNDELCEMSGYTKDELLATPTSLFFNEESMTVRKQRLDAVAKGENVSDDVEYRLRCKDGEFKWFLVKIRHAMQEGRLVGGTAIMYDITERKSREEKIQNRFQELENDLKEKMRELNDTNLVLLSKKGELDRITSEHELIRQQVIENKNAIATLAKNMEQIHHEAETQIMMDLKKVQLPILERMKSDRKLESYKNDVDFLIRQFSSQSSLSSEKAHIIYSLTPAELQIASQIGRGMSSEEIAAYLNISLNTVKTHRKNIRKKLGLIDSKENLFSFLKPHL